MGMVDVKIAVGKRIYSIQCEEENQERLNMLANRLNRKINEMSFQMKNIDEQTILVMHSLIVMDDLDAMVTEKSEDESGEQSDLSVELEALYNRVIEIKKALENK
jgi:cell division protein ZapA (FtsZ GTPase activity inhibitor)